MLIKNISFGWAEISGPKSGWAEASGHLQDQSVGCGQFGKYRRRVKTQIITGHILCASPCALVFTHDAAPWCLLAVVTRIPRWR